MPKTCKSWSGTSCGAEALAPFGAQVGGHLGASQRGRRLLRGQPGELLLGGRPEKGRGGECHEAAG